MLEVGSTSSETRRIDGRDERDHSSRICPWVASEQKSRTLPWRSRPMASHPSSEAFVASRVYPRRDTAVLWGCARSVSCASSAWITTAEVPAWGLDEGIPGRESRA